MKELNNLTIWNEASKEGMVLTNFIQLDNNLIRAIISECGTGAACLYLLLLSHRNIKTNQCFPTLETLSREMGGITIRQVSTYLKRLSEKELIKIDSGKSGIANNYYFIAEDFYKENAESALAYKRSTQGFPHKQAKIDNPVLKSTASTLTVEQSKPKQYDDDDFDF